MTPLPSRAPRPPPSPASRRSSWAEATTRGRDARFVRRVALVAGLIVVVALVVWMLGDKAGRRPSGPAVDGSGTVQHHASAELIATEDPVHAPRLESEAAAAAPLQAPALPRVAGIVVRAADGSPLDNVRLVPLLGGHDADFGEWFDAYTRGGRFELESDVVAQGVRALICTWTQLDTSFDFEGSTRPGRQLTQTVVLTDVDTPLDDLRITFDTGWDVRGRVLDGEGQPVPTARLGTDRDASHVWCDDDGVFILRDVPWDDSDLVVSASARGYTSARSLVFAPERPACIKSVELTLVREP